MPARWSPATHPSFPAPFRSAVRTVLLVAGAGGEAGSHAPAAPEFNLLASMRSVEPHLLQQVVEALAAGFMAEEAAKC